MKCFHQLRIRGRLHLCRHCGVAIEECPCFQNRVPDGKCDLCLGSGWLATVRSDRQKFMEYADIGEPIPDPDGW